MYEQSENFNREKENIRQHQKEVMGLKNTTELKTTVEGLNNRLDEEEEKIHELKDRTMELIQSEHQKGKRMKESEDI